MDEGLLKIAQHDAYGSLGLDPDPELAFAGIRALRGLADFCEGYEVHRLREAGHSWVRIAACAGVTHVHVTWIVLRSEREAAGCKNALTRED